MQIKKNFQKGISLLEVLLSLTIIAIILVMAVRYFFVAENNNRINTTRQDIGSLIAAVNAWKGKNPEYTPALTIVTLLNDGDLTLSSSMKVTGVPPAVSSANLFNPWGQEILLNVVPGSATAAVTISTTLPENSDCVSLRNSYPSADACSDGKFELHFS